MNDHQFVAFLQWCLPQMGMRWRGFRKVRRQVRRRISRRMEQLGIEALADYRKRLESCPDEWSVLDSFCRISISRFYRDKAVFEHLATNILPAAAELVRQRGDRQVRAWSIGCASGEEPYTLAILWQQELASKHPDLLFSVVATDSSAEMLQRAARAEYLQTAVKDLPATWIDDCFERDGDGYRLRAPLRTFVRFEQQDIRGQSQLDASGAPQTFHLILCRNLAFTYFDDTVQREVLQRIAKHLEPGGFLIIGHSEQLPTGEFGLTNIDARLKSYRTEFR